MRHSLFIVIPAFLFYGTEVQAVTMKWPKGQSVQRNPSVQKQPSVSPSTAKKPKLVSSPRTSHESGNDYRKRVEADAQNKKKTGLEAPVRKKGESVEKYDGRVKKYESDVRDVRAGQQHTSLKAIETAKPKPGESDEAFKRRQQRARDNQERKYAQEN